LKVLGATPRFGAGLGGEGGLEGGGIGGGEGCGGGRDGGGGWEGWGGQCHSCMLIGPNELPGPSLFFVANL
jgi:hypothetical protein